MSDPYRERERGLWLDKLLAEERALLVRAGNAMLAAGALGLIAVLVGLQATIQRGALGRIFDLLPALVAGLTLSAGFTVVRLPGGSGDYKHIERALRSLRVVYQVKGAFAVLVVAFLCLVFVLRG